MKQRLGFSQSGVSVPGGAHQWTVDPGTELLSIMGWGVLDQLSQEDGLDAQTDAPAWLDTSVQAFWDKGLSWVGIEMNVGLMRMDDDYWTPYLNAGLPQPAPSTAEGQAWNRHKADPVLTGSFDNLESYLNWRLTFIRALRAEGISRGKTLKVWVKMHDYPNTNTTDCPWYYDASTGAHTGEYGDGVLAFWQWLAANEGWVPDALDVMNEPNVNGNTWTNSEVLAAANDAVTKLQNAGYTPLIIGPSYTGTTNFGQGNFDNWHNSADSNGWLPDWWPSTHHYINQSGHTGDEGIRFAARSFASMLAAASPPQTLGMVLTEDILSPLGLVTLMAIGATVSTFNYTCAVRYSTTFDGGQRGRLWHADTDGSITPEFRTVGLLPIFQTLRAGDRLISATKANLSDSDDAELIAALDAETGKLKVILVDNTGGVAKNVKGLPAGVYYLTWQDYAITATEKLRAPTGASGYSIGAAQEIGERYIIQSGEAICLNQQNGFKPAIYVLREIGSELPDITPPEAPAFDGDPTADVSTVTVALVTPVNAAGDLAGTAVYLATSPTAEPADALLVGNQPVIDTADPSELVVQFFGIPAGSLYAIAYSFDFAGNQSARVASAQFVVPTASAPLAPSNVAASQNGPGNNRVTWVDEASNETSYEMHRLHNGADDFEPDTDNSTTRIAVLPPGTELYDDPTALYGESYAYKPVARNAQGVGVPAIGATVETESGIATPIINLSFSDYADTAAMLADPNIAFSNPQSDWSLITDGANKYCRRRFPGEVITANIRNDITRVMRIDLPPGLNDLWIEYRRRYIDWHNGVPNTTMFAIGSVTGSFEYGDQIEVTYNGVTKTATVYKIQPMRFTPGVAGSTHSLVFKGNSGQGFGTLFHPGAGSTVQNVTRAGSCVVMSDDAGNDTCAYKDILIYSRDWGGGLPQGGNGGRTDLETGNNPGQSWHTVRPWIPGVDSNQSGADVQGPDGWDFLNLADENFHITRLHGRHNSAPGVADGTFVVYHDDVLLHDYGITNSDFQEYDFVQNGANRNQREIHDMFRDDDYLRVFTVNPGWGF